MLSILLSIGMTLLAESPRTRPASKTTPESISRGYALLKNEFAKDGDSFVRLPDDVRAALVSERERLSKWISEYRTMTRNAKSRIAREAMGEPLKWMMKWQQSNTVVPPSELALPPLVGARPGMLGRIAGIRVLQVIDDTTARAKVVDVYDLGVADAMLKGWPTTDWADDRFVRMNDVALVTGTHTYTTVLGSTRTVPLVERVDIGPFVKGLSKADFDELLRQAGLDEVQFTKTLDATRCAARDEWALRVVNRIDAELVAKRRAPVRRSTRDEAGAPKPIRSPELVPTPEKPRRQRSGR